ncbi:MAG TPA: hypothetical protein VHD15_15995 [Hyphomicrobiales bacterium]|nr:hypothetical protein [Hyphomicrobiales bacterium]
MAATTAAEPSSVHLVGSIALDSVPEVFQTAGRVLGRRLGRIPDGEPGGRRLWISWQYPLLRANGYLRAGPPDVASGMGFQPLALAPGVKAADIHFGELGYAREARASYEDFLAARAAGEIPADARFQVCLPTPYAVISAFCRGPDMLAIEAAYERAMIAEIGRIAAAIPHRDLCIQFDVCNEMVMIDGQLPFFRPPTFDDPMAEVMARLKRLAAAVPEDVELGIHLCYGDLDAKHFVEPRDAAKLVEMANALAGGLPHALAYVHMPVPAGRDDDGYFAPLDRLALNPATELFLGLVHSDGAEATRRRIAAAAPHARAFGIATECGIARQRTPDLVRSLLEVHAACSAEPARTGAPS